MHAITKATALPGFRLKLVFDDGTEGTVDLSGDLHGEVFEPLKNNLFFSKVRVDEFGAVCWPNGLDLDPDVLFSEVTGAALPGAETFKKKAG